MRSGLLRAALGAALVVVAAMRPSAQSYTPVLSYAVSGTTVTLTWTAVATATSYEVAASGLGTIAVGNVLTLSGAVAPGFYDVQVRGRAGAVVGPWSNPVTIPVAVNTPAPSNLSGILNGNGVLLTWDLPSTRGLTSLTGQLLTPQGGIAGVVAVPVGTTYAAAGIPAGTYSIRVVGDGPAGPSTPSNAVTFAVPGCLAAAPLPLAVDSAGAVSMQWPAVPGAIGYVLEAATAPGGPLVASIAFGPAHTSFSTTAAAGTYYVTLRATLACGATASSTLRTVTVTQPQNPPVNWTKEEWRVWFFGRVAARGLSAAVTFDGMVALRPDLLGVGADWQNGWRGDLRPRLYLPVAGCPPPSLSTAPACSYSHAVDVAESALGGPWAWVPRF